MLVHTEEYIEYLKSFETVPLDNAINEYRNNRMDFDALELTAINENCYSRGVYSKSFAIGKLLGD